MKDIKLGSLFDGSAGFPLAGYIYGMTPVWASEIEPYPIRVTTKRLPFMKHYGDISKMNGAEIEPVDIITGGSPCQDMSVAGKRAGLDGERSGLFREQIRIIKEMREATNGQYPRYMVWENVPGALSSNKGADFRCVLEETARIKDPTFDVPMPAKNKWNTAGLIMGDDFSIGWRILDAQYWGVPQRRRRIFLVADFGGTSAREILFKREGLSWHFAQSREAWQTATGNLKAGIDETGWNPIYSIDREAMNAGYEFDRAPGIDESETAYTLKATGPGGVAHPAIMIENHPNDSRVKIDESGTCQSLTGRMGTGGGNVPLTMQPIPIQDQAISNGSGNGKGIAEPDEPMYTLMAGTHHGVAYSLQGNMIGRADKNGPQGNGINEDVNFTLNATDRHVVAFDRASFNQGQNAQYDPQFYEDGIMPTLIAKGPGGVCHENKAYRMEAFGQYSESEDASTLKNRDYKDATDLIVDLDYIVRRLIPLECARLQGFPDWWTANLGTKEEDITDEMMDFWREVFETHRKIVTGTEKPKTDKQIRKWLMEPDSDAAEYKMWGNGVALPCVLYVMEGIAQVLRNE